MNTNDRDSAFAGSIPALYEKYLVPMIFEPYAADIADRVAARRPARVLELAAGTGAVTRRLASVLPSCSQARPCTMNCRPPTRNASPRTGAEV